MNVYKEKDETKQDSGKYKLYAVVGDQKMSTTLSFKDLNSFFDRVTTPAQLVEKNFGEKLHLASAYEKYKLPEGAKPENIRIAKDKQTCVDAGCEIISLSDADLATLQDKAQVVYDMVREKLGDEKVDGLLNAIKAL
jgi:hypothetical protein